jgi:hypothetical protein
MKSDSPDMPKNYGELVTILPYRELHFNSPTAERRRVLCVGVGGDRTHAAHLGGAGHALANWAGGGGQNSLVPTRLGRQNTLPSKIV